MRCGSPVDQSRSQHLSRQGRTSFEFFNMRMSQLRNFQSVRPLLARPWLTCDEINVTALDLCVSSEDIAIFVKLPSNKYITLILDPAIDKIAAVKEKIEGKARFPRARQSLYFRGKLLDDSEVLATYSIVKDSTLQLQLWAEPRYKIEVRVLPTNRLISVPIKNGLEATIRELKDSIRHKEGVECKDLYLEDDFTGDLVEDHVTLEALRVPEQTLVWVQSGIVGVGSPSYYRPTLEARRRRRVVTRELLDTALEDALQLPTRRTLPLLGDMEPLKEVQSFEEIQIALQQQKPNQKGGKLSDIETTIATMLQTHQDCDRKLSLMSLENNKLQMDLRKLQSKYPKLLSDVMEEKDRLERELKELQREFPRQLSLVLDEKNKMQQHSEDLERELVHMSVVLDENSQLQRDTILLHNELDSLRNELGRERERSLCNICFDKPRDTLVFSCLHLHFCSSCLQKHQERNNTCPTCRGFISGKLVCNVSIS